MKKTIYLVNKQAISDQRKNLIEVTGEEFFQRVSSLEGKKLYFIRLTDDITYENAEIVIEVSQGEYKQWRKEYDAHRYLALAGNELIIISLDSGELLGRKLLFSSTASEDCPEMHLIKKEDYCKLRNALMQLTFEERNLIDRLYLDENPSTERELAAQLHITQQAVSKQKKKSSKK